MRLLARELNNILLHQLVRATVWVERGNASRTPATMTGRVAAVLSLDARRDCWYRRILGGPHPELSFRLECRNDILFVRRDAQSSKMLTCRSWRWLLRAKFHVRSFDTELMSFVITAYGT